MARVDDAGARLALPTSTAAPALARRRVREHGQAWPTDLLDAVLLLTTEVVTNAVRYGHGGVTVLVQGDSAGHAVRVEVTDANPELPTMPSPNGTAVSSESGRGLHLLAQLTSGWGALPTTTGKTVWFTMGSG